MATANELPRIIQGGMGIGVSTWRLARATSKAGLLGVVSGTALDTVFVRRLQLGDPGGDVRRALSHFPWPLMAQQAINEYFIEGGKAPDAPFRLLSMPALEMKPWRQQLMVLANFVEVFLAKEGHDGPVGINYLEKIQIPTLPSLMGAILAGVDVVLMGAGIPLSVPGTLDTLAAFRPAELKLHLEDNPNQLSFTMRFSPAEVLGDQPYPLQRPVFLAIISSHVIAKTLLRKASGRVDGFVVETHVAGGHNAPPRKQRGAKQSGAEASKPSDLAQAAKPPTFSEIDMPDIGELASLGAPFWMAGSLASPEGLAQVRSMGAHGIQVGTPFAFCEESGIPSTYKRELIERYLNGDLRVVTDFNASPTGYPFKLIEDHADPQRIERARNRARVCDLGYLRQAFVTPEGQCGFRCPSEPAETHAKKGGSALKINNKLCLCNGLLATVGLGQSRKTGEEVPIFTAGEELVNLRRFLKRGFSSYTARDVAEFLLGPAASAEEPRPVAPVAELGL